MFKYAQLDEEGRCISLSYLSGEVESDYMKPLEDTDDVQPGDMFDGTTWTRPEPVPYVPPKTPEQLEIEGLKSQIAVMQDAILALMDLA